MFLALNEIISKLVQNKLEQEQYMLVNCDCKKLAKAINVLITSIIDIRYDDGPGQLFLSHSDQHKHQHDVDSNKKFRQRCIQNHDGTILQKQPPPDSHLTDIFDNIVNTSLMRNIISYQSIRSCQSMSQSPKNVNLAPADEQNIMQIFSNLMASIFQKSVINCLNWQLSTKN